MVELQFEITPKKDIYNLHELVAKKGVTYKGKIESRYEFMFYGEYIDILGENLQSYVYVAHDDTDYTIVGKGVKRIGK
mgnify:CR=1 FL=1